MCTWCTVVSFNSLCQWISTLHCITAGYNAITTIYYYNEEKLAYGIAQLMICDRILFVQFTCFIFSRLTHSLATDTSSICLFVKDLDLKNRDYSPTVNHFKDLLRAKGVPYDIEVRKSTVSLYLWYPRLSLCGYVLNTKKYT